MAHQILVISPVRNEAAHIERVVRAVAAQELTPAAWIVIDDSSTDATLELLRALAVEVPFMKVVKAPRHAHHAAQDRLARAAAPRNFNSGLAIVEPWEFTHVMKLDGDIELPPDYFRKIMEQFDANPRLGLAAGVLVEPAEDGSSRPIIIPPHHVHGALKLYSTECFQAIGGVQERLGWDTIDETYARMRGFDTRSFKDIVSMHLRPIGSADGTMRGRARHGECAWIVHYSPAWVVLRSLKVARQRPVGLSGAAFVYGYARAAACGVERVPDPDFRAFTRRELRRRMLVGARAVLSGSSERSRVWEPA